MRKLIKSIILFTGFYFCAATVNAQLSSDKPSFTPQQMNDLIEKRKAEAKAVAEKIAAAPVLNSNSNKSTSTKPAEAHLNQGKEVNTKKVEGTGAPKVPMQDQKEKPKDQ